MRGKVPQNGQKVKNNGITPACAGKRAEDVEANKIAKDHPRVCGEKILDKYGRLSVEGSPPRVRGKVFPIVIIVIADRITPACAGKSCQNQSKVCTIWDHPRVCGEKSILASVITRTLGSPPRVRGKVLISGRSNDCTGITPACAGKSCILHGCLAMIRDHPRVCGEKKTKLGKSICHKGSPPRVRGKVLLIPHTFLGCRITPACAGKRDAASANGQRF